MGAAIYLPALLPHAGVTTSQTGRSTSHQRRFGFLLLELAEPAVGQELAGSNCVRKWELGIDRV